MTEVLARAIAAAEKLSPERQDEIARMILAFIEKRRQSDVGDEAPGLPDTAAEPTPRI